MNCSAQEIVDAIITAAVRRGNDGRGKGGLDGRMFTLARTDPESFGILLEAALRLKMKAAPEHRAAERILTEEEIKEEIKAQLRERGLPEELLKYIYDPNEPRAELSTDAQPNGTRELMRSSTPRYGTAAIATARMACWATCFCCSAPSPRLSSG
jgi:hypothetical protein